MTNYKVKGEILAPVHIGTEEEIEPFDYVIRAGKFHRISLEDCLTELNDGDRARFYNLTETSDLNVIRKFLTERISPERHSIYTTDVRERVARIYESKLEDIRNQLLIKPFIRTDEQKRPYLPGSSIKGAIRTALLSTWATERGLPKPEDFEEANFEAKILEAEGFKGKLDVRRDPFRTLKIADADLPERSTVIAEVKNVGKKEGQFMHEAIQMLVETTWAALLDKSVTFETTLAIDEQLAQTSKAVSRKITLEDLTRACQKFYKSVARKDHDFFQGTAIDVYAERIFREAEKIEQDMPDSFLIRMGRFSGVYSVTLDEPYRNPRPPRGRGYGTTRNLFEGKYPMGWVKLALEPQT